MVSGRRENFPISDVQKMSYLRVPDASPSRTVPTSLVTALCENKKIKAHVAAVPSTFAPHRKSHN
ncbi:hypothetical protein O3G_MSEX012175 [Manduca sexta]|uniref:Uncharacterized protein n=1 Tax=Manduca sexta TaxID=7130 RepID=A0A921ZP09_MANSE|nr:hypothetical protein O3G_MSEX012175 [Manduca sexta]